MDEAQLRSFLLVRAFLDRAGAALDGTDPGAMTCVVLYDLAVETAAKATVNAHPPPEPPFPGGGYLVLTNEQKQKQRAKTRDPSLPHVLDELLASARARSSNIEPVRQIREAADLRDLRNRVQHQAEAPPSSRIESARDQAVGFVAWALDVFFDQTIEGISRASLIASEDVRHWIEKAENEAAGDLEVAAKYVAIALMLARIEFRNLQPWDERRKRLRPFDITAALSELTAGSARPHASHPRTRTLLEVMAGTLEQLADKVDALTLGAAASEYAWFGRHFPVVIDATTLNGPLDLVPGPVPAGMTRETYERGRDFVISAALHWQQFPTPLPETDV